MVPTASLARSVTVGEIARGLGRQGARLSGDPAVQVSGLCQDSRRILAGEMFAARSGKHQQGAAFIQAALGRGASALLVEAGSLRGPSQVPVIEVDNVERGIAFAAEAAFGSPSQKLKVVGITGTNGKTTSAWLLQHALTGAGSPTARLGTLGFDFQGMTEDVGLTTPEADAVSRFERQALDRGASHFVMEVSSQALVQNRVEGQSFSVAVFTNFTQDHLDLHGSMEAYFAAKARLFTVLEPECSVIHTDSDWGKRLARMAKGRVITVGLEKTAQVCAREWSFTASGLTASVALPSGVVDVQAPLSGQHNLENVLTALAVAEALKLDVQQVCKALGSVPQVPGRMERCDVPEDDVVVVVDYAHTPDALTRVLTAARGLGTGKLSCVFGCGGDRDAQKRPLMGKSVREHADLAFITNDNPRSESPDLIAKAIESAFLPDTTQHRVVLDRADAILQAISTASSGDVVVIAGKGHETYQIIGAKRSDFDDRAHSLAALARRRVQRRHG